MRKLAKFIETDVILFSLDDRYAEIGLRAYVAPYLDRMQVAYSAADLALGPMIEWVLALAGLQALEAPEQFGGVAASRRGGVPEPDRLGQARHPVHDPGAQRIGLADLLGPEKPGRGGRRYAPYAFTEQGVAMLSTVLNSPRAVAVNIEIMRAFVRLRLILASNNELARRLDQLDAKTDAKFKAVFEAIRQLMTPPEPKKRPIGFLTPKEK